MKTILIYIIIALALIISTAWFVYSYDKKEKQRIENNYLAALEEVRKTNAESQRVFTLGIQEVKQQFPEIKTTLADMGIKLKNVQAISNVNTETHTSINTLIRDSVVRDSVHVKTARFSDKWTMFSMMENKDSVHVDLQSHDSLVCVLNRIPRTLWQWLRGDPKMVRNDIKNYNPHTKITYNRVIEIK